MIYEEILTPFVSEDEPQGDTPAPAEPEEGSKETPEEGGKEGEGESGGEGNA